MPNFPPKPFTDPSHWKWPFSSSGHHEADLSLPPSISIHVQSLCVHTFTVLNLFWVTDLLRIWWTLQTLFPCHLPLPQKNACNIPIQTHIYTFVYNSKSSMHPRPPHKDSPVFRCRAPHTPPQVISTLIRDISGSHNALLTGSDCEWLHTNILFIYQPSYFYISSPLKHKWSIYLIWIGSQWIFVMTTKGTKKWVTKRQQLLLFLFFPTPLKPYLKVITPVFWTALDWTLFPPDYTKLILWNHC